MAYLHSRRPAIIHRDLTSLNILVDAHWQCKVADFGMSRLKDGAELMTKQPGNLRWMAPEARCLLACEFSTGLSVGCR
jgi:serine/threonine protein kinase